MEIQNAVPEDAPAMSRILTEILESWKSPRPRSPQHVLEHYITHPNRIKCSVAKDDLGTVLGFQSLQIARDDNPFDLPAGWGIIGTYVDLKTGRKGVGKALFASSKEAAIVAGLTKIDATISDSNTRALVYYDAMGFETYKTKPGTIKKRLIVS